MRAQADAWSAGSEDSADHYAGRPGWERAGLIDDFDALDRRSIERDTDSRFAFKAGLHQYDCREASSIVGKSDVFSANVIPTPSGSSFIATSLPTSETMPEMLKAMVERRGPRHSLYQTSESEVGKNDVVIVQLTNFKDPAPRYLPANTHVAYGYQDEADSTADAYTIKLDKPLGYDEKLHSIVSDATVKTARSDGQTQANMHIKHIHFPHWPDCDVPANPQQLADLVKGVTSIRKELPASQIWVHCMAGAGRTGTFISFAPLLEDPSAVPPESTLQSMFSDVIKDPVYATVDSLRDYRGRQVLTPGQLGLMKDIVDHESGVGWSDIERQRVKPSAPLTSHTSCSSQAASAVPSVSMSAPMAAAA